MDVAFKHYERALQINPRHRGAHEYVGEAYLIAGNLAKAQEHLAALQKICLIPCEEYGDLKKKIDAYGKSAGRSYACGRRPASPPAGESMINFLC